MVYRVLIVDDGALIRAMLKHILSKRGYEIVAEAVDGRQALELYKFLRPDVVTLDMLLPDKNGIEVLEEIMAFDPKAKVIMCTGISEQAMVIKAIQAGAKDFIVKPFQIPTLVEKLKQVLSN